MMQLWDWLCGNISILIMYEFSIYKLCALSWNIKFGAAWIEIIDWRAAGGLNFFGQKKIIKNNLPLKIYGII